MPLERRACPGGSVLGELPGAPQPPQKLFDSLLWNSMRRFDSARPVFVEAESRKIGQLQVPAALLERMREGGCIRMEAPVGERVRFLLSEYRHFLDDPEALKSKLGCLTGLYAREMIDRWLRLIDERAWDELVADLLVRHYDPAYSRSTRRNYPDPDRAIALNLDRLTPEAIDTAAADLLARTAHEPAAA